MLTNKLLITLYWITTIAAGQIYGVFTDLSIEFVPPPGYPEAIPTSASWENTFSWSIDSSTAIAGDTFILDATCFQYATSDTTIDLVANGIPIATCDLYSDGLFCTVLPSINPSFDYSGQIVVPLTYKVGGICVDIYHAGDNTMSFTDGVNTISDTATFISRAPSGNSNTQDIAASEGQVIGGSCPNGISSGVLSVEAVNGVMNCAEGTQMISNNINDWFNLITFESNFQYTVSCIGNKYEIHYQNIPAGYRVVVNAPYVNDPTLSKSVNYVNEYTCVGATGPTVNNLSVNWGNPASGETGSSGSGTALTTVTITKTGTDSTSSTSTLPHLSGGTVTVSIDVPSPTVTVSATWTGSTTQTTTLSATEGGTVTVSVGIPAPTTPTTTVTGTWTGTTPQTTTFPATEGGTVTVSVDVPAPITPTTTVTGTWTGTTPQTTTFPATEGGTVTVSVDVPAPTTPTTTVTGTWTGTTPQTTTLPATEGGTVTVSIDIPAPTTPTTTVTGTWTGTTPQTTTLPATEGGTVTVSVDIPAPTDPSDSAAPTITVTGTWTGTTPQTTTLPFTSGGTVTVSVDLPYTSSIKYWNSTIASTLSSQTIIESEIIDVSTPVDVQQSATTITIHTQPENTKSIPNADDTATTTVTKHPNAPGNTNVPENTNIENPNFPGNSNVVTKTINFTTSKTVQTQPQPTGTKAGTNPSANPTMPPPSVSTYEAGSGLIQLSAFVCMIPLLFINNLV